MHHYFYLNKFDFKILSKKKHHLKFTCIFQSIQKSIQKVFRNLNTPEGIRIRIRILVNFDKSIRIWIRILHKRYSDVFEYMPHIWYIPILLLPVYQTVTYADDHKNTKLLLSWQHKILGETQQTSQVEL